MVAMLTVWVSRHFAIPELVTLCWIANFLASGPLPGCTDHGWLSTLRASMEEASADPDHVLAASAPMLPTISELTSPMLNTCLHVSCPYLYVDLQSRAHILSASGAPCCGQDATAPGCLMPFTHSGGGRVACVHQTPPAWALRHCTCL